jgi:hypothetical protein
MLDLLNSIVVHLSVSEQRVCLCVRAPCIRALPSSALYSSLTSRDVHYDQACGVYCDSV